MKTQGHLENNGGIRGHSAGDIFPFIVFMRGDKWRILNPNGKERRESYFSSKVIYPLAIEIHKKWLKTGKF